MAEPDRRAHGVGQRLRRVRSLRFWPQACTLLGSPRAWCEYWVELWHTPPFFFFFYKDYLFKEGNKTGRHAKLHSMHQLSPVWKGYCWKLKSVFLCSWAVLRDCVWMTGKDRQMEAEVLGAGYADRGQRFERLLHPAVDIIAVLTKKKKQWSLLYGTSVKCHIKGWVKQKEVQYY